MSKREYILFTYSFAFVKSNCIKFLLEFYSSSFLAIAKFLVLSIVFNGPFMHVAIEYPPFLSERQLESVYLHIIIHGTEIQARITNLEKRNSDDILSCYCVIL
jgi:hypothetical protein